MQNITAQLAQELKVATRQVDAAVALLDGGATVPFIARYRKEATGGLDDIQLRELEQRLGYLRELHARQAVVLKSIEEQDKLTPALQAADDDAIHRLGYLVQCCRRFAGNDHHIVGLKMFLILLHQFQCRFLGFHRVNSARCRRISRFHGQSAGAGADIHHDITRIYPQQ